MDDLSEIASCVAALLRATGRRLVLAESCTGGLVAASLTETPGISEFLCGSAVVYRTATKTAWLGIDPGMLDDPLIGPVSAETTRALALAALERTPEADLSAAVTGHLGPDAPPAEDGRVYIAVATRDGGRRIASESVHDLGQPAGNVLQQRRGRQQEAARLVLDAVAAALRP